MANVFSKFFMSIGLTKKSGYLPAPVETSNMVTNATTSTTIYKDVANYSVKPYQTIASFDLAIEEPKYRGAIPDATIKFYPLDK